MLLVLTSTNVLLTSITVILTPLATTPLAPTTVTVTAVSEAMERHAKTSMNVLTAINVIQMLTVQILKAPTLARAHKDSVFKNLKHWKKIFKNERVKSLKFAYFIIRTKNYQKTMFVGKMFRVRVKNILKAFGAMENPVKTLTSV